MREFELFFPGFRAGRRFPNLRPRPFVQRAFDAHSRQQSDEAPNWFMADVVQTTSRQIAERQCRQRACRVATICNF